jgi:tetratricopeptide (TPR) repeat protein
VGVMWTWKSGWWVLAAAVLLLAGCSSGMYEQYLEEGTAELTSGDFEKAVVSFEKAQEAKETDEAAELILASKAAKMAAAHLGEGKFEEAEVFAEEAISLAVQGAAHDAIRSFAEEIRKQAVAEKERITLIEEDEKRKEEALRVEEEEKHNEKTSMTKEEAVQRVIDTTGIAPSETFFVEYDHQTPEGHFVIHLYEVVIDDPETREGHTATYGWYGVVLETGEVYDYLLRSE